MRNITLWQSSLALVTAVTFGGCIAEDDAPSTSDPADTAGPAERSAAPSPLLSHCIAAAVAMPSGKPATADAASPAMQCFASFSEAMSAATQGRVQLPASATPATVDERMLNSGAQAASSDFVLGIEYVDINYGGASITFHSATTCNDGIHGMPDLRMLGWNDLISSALAFSGCNNALHYQDINFSGPLINCGAGCSTMGIMNDQTSSILWTR